MLAHSLQVLASVFIFTNCINGFGRHGTFGVHQLPLKSGESRERHCSAATWLDHSAPYWLKPFLYTFWHHGFARIVLRASGRPAAWQADDSCDAPQQQSHNDLPGIGEIPQYVFDYAPLVHLYSEEKFWPCDIADHLLHITPQLNYTPIYPRTTSLNLTNLDGLNEWDEGHFVYLTSDDNVEESPDWLTRPENVPVPNISERFIDGNTYSEAFTAFGADNHRNTLQSTSAPASKRRRRYSSPLGDKGTERTRKGRRKYQHGGRSNAPAFLIYVNKGKGIVDAFWFFFYGFNLGNMVFNIRFGNHVGDWEHILVRFQHGVPKYVFFSEHNFGAAYSYGAVEKIGKRPVAYSAVGTHAMYATPGAHPYILPLGILHDETDRGPLWDPLLNSHVYTYNHLTDDLHASNITPDAPTEWFYFAGRWGDKVYPLEDSRQYRFATQYHYVSGPLGPRFKNLGRRKVCQGHYNDPCVIKNWLAPSEMMYWEGPGDGED